MEHKLKFYIITCPNLSLITNFYQQLIVLINEFTILHHDISLIQHGRIKDSYEILYGERSDLKEVYEMIDKVMLYKVDYMIDWIPDDQNAAALPLFISDYLHSKFGYNFGILTKIIKNPDGKEGILFDPYIIGDIEDGILYLSYDDLTASLNLKNFLGRIPIGSDPMVEYIMKDPKSEERYGLNLGDVEKIEGIYTLPMSSDIPSIEGLRSDYLDQIVGLRFAGYFPIEVANLKDRAVYKNLCSLASIPVLYENTNYIFMYCSTDLKLLLNQEPVNFLQDNFNRIITDLIPVITLTGSWQNYLEMDPIMVVRMTFILMRILYKFPILRKYIPNEVMVSFNGSIRIPFTSISDVKQIKESFERELSKVKDLFVMEVSSLTDGLIYRWLISRIKGHSFDSMILSESCKLYLVSTHSLTLDDLNKGKAKGKAKARVRTQIKEMILNHLSELCGFDSDPVYLTKFSDMSLEELSTIIRPEKESPYCYTADTIRKLTDKTSPITRKPLQSWVLDIAENPSLMIRGFLPLGSIPGLMQVSDFRQIDTKPVDGELVMDDLKGLNLKETVIQIKMSNGDLVDFMELNTILLEPDFKLLVDLWNKGYFLNIWGTITNIYLEKLELPGSLKFDPMLYLGKGMPVQVAEVIDRIRYTGGSN